MSDLYYFGCIGQAGHRYWKFVNRRPTSATYKNQPPGPWGYSIDSSKISPAYGPQGDAYVHHKDGWTALAVVDRTGDSRPNSRSVFITEGDLSFDPMFTLITDTCDLLDRIGPLHPQVSV